MKKLLSFLMACSMLLALGAGAFAVDNELVKFTVDTKNVVIGSNSVKDVELAITPSDYSGSGIDGAVFNVTYNSSDIEYVTDTEGNPIVEWNTKAFDNLMGGIQASEGNLKLTFGSSAINNPTDWVVKLHFKVKTNDVAKIGTTLPIGGTVQYVTAGNDLVEGGDLVAGGIKVVAAKEHKEGDPTPVDKAVPAPSDATADGVIHYEPAKEPTLFEDGHKPYYWMKDPDAGENDQPGLVYFNDDPSDHMNDPEWLKAHTINPTDATTGEPDPYSQNDINTNTDHQWDRNPMTDGDPTKGWPDDLTELGDDDTKNTADDDKYKRLDYMLGDTTGDRKRDLRDFNAFSRLINKVPPAQQKAVLTNLTNPEAAGMPFWNINAVGCSAKTDKHQVAEKWTINSVPTATALLALFNYIAYDTEMVTEYENHEDIINNAAYVLQVNN